MLTNVLGCASCERMLPEDRFRKNPTQSRGWDYSCKDCTELKRILNWYGLSRVAYLNLVDSQGGKCGICYSQPQTLCVDHDHACCPGKKSCGKCVRGLLCQRCNKALGVVNDDTGILVRMVEYLNAV